MFDTKQKKVSEVKVQNGRCFRWCIRGIKPWQLGRSSGNGYFVHTVICSGCHPRDFLAVTPHGQSLKCQSKPARLSNQFTNTVLYTVSITAHDIARLCIQIYTHTCIMEMRPILQSTQSTDLCNKSFDYHICQCQNNIYNRHAGAIMYMQKDIFAIYLASYEPAHIITNSQPTYM